MQIIVLLIMRVEIITYGIVIPFAFLLVKIVDLMMIVVVMTTMPIMKIMRMMEPIDENCGDAVDTCIDVDDVGAVANDDYNASAN